MHAYWQCHYALERGEGEQIPFPYVQFLFLCVFHASHFFLCLGKTLIV